MKNLDFHKNKMSGVLTAFENVGFIENMRRGIHKVMAGTCDTIQFKFSVQYLILS